MSIAERVALGLYIAVVVAALIRHIGMWFIERKIPVVDSKSPQFDSQTRPLVSILVPAKDEEATIAICVKRLLKQTYREIEVLVVDDRSDDRTAEIVTGLLPSDSRLRLIQIRDLPPDWTGKTHALFEAQKQAKGDWLLFVDADTELDETCVSRILADAVANGADLESLLPSLKSASFWERVIQPFAGICLMVFYPLNLVNDPKRRDMGFANGQFILIRRTAYDAIGGHESVRDKFVEDIHLGRKVREAGLPLRVVLAPELVSVRMYVSLREIVRGWSRILYSAVDCRAWRLWILFFSILIFSALSYAMLTATGFMLLTGNASPTVWRYFWLAVAHQFLQSTLMARIYAHSKSQKKYLAFRILAVGVMFYIILRAIRMCSTHQVTWRGTSYTLGKGTA